MHIHRLSLTLLAVGALCVVAAASADASQRPHPSRHHRQVCSTATGKNASCAADVVVDASGTPIVGTTPLASAMGPAQFHTGYNLPSNASQNETIGIVDAYSDPSVVSDLAEFDTYYGLPAFPSCSSSVTTSCLAVLDQNGGTNFPPENNGWSLEIDLDVQAAHEICQNCKIVLIEANSNSLSDLEGGVAQAVAQGATQVSNSYISYGYEPSSNAGYNYPDVAIIAASGDDGYGIGAPADLNSSVAVGGTSLVLNSDNTYNRETVWSGTGSGCDTVNSAQPWQTAEPDWSATGCGNFRAVVDVAADADPNTGASVYNCYYSTSCGFYQVGGTSLASPVIAAVYALGGSAANNDLPAALVYRSSVSSGLHDVTAGSNGTCTVTLQCTAAAGYDLPTGMGTPDGLSAFEGTYTPPPPKGEPGSIAAQFIAPSNMSTASSPTVPYSISWTAGTCASGSTYTLTEAVNGGTPSTVYTGTGLSTTVNLAPGSSYTLSANCGGAGRATTFTLTGIQETAATYTGKWTTSAFTGAYGGTAKYSTAKSASASYTCSSCEAIAWVTDEDSNHGSAKVYIDGKLKTTISTHSSTTNNRLIVYKFGWASDGKHTIKIVNVGTKKTNRVTIDGFLTRS